MDEEELRQQVLILEEANNSLLEGHGKVSIAYVCLRIKNVEDRIDKALLAYLKLNKRIDALEADA